MPSSAWKKRVLKVDWYAGETISVAIGQGYVSLTPIQTARAFGGLALGGVLKTPHVVSRDELEHWGQKASVSYESRFELNTETVDKVTLGLWGVVNEWGTGHRAAVPGFDVCGKTGTAQVVAKDLKVSAESKDEFGDNAWFVGFAPRLSAEIAAAIFVEHGGHGGDTAAPIAHEMFQVYYDKKTKSKEPHQLSMTQGESVFRVN
jgi:penicillin-binding protein 2